MADQKLISTLARETASSNKENVDMKDKNVSHVRKAQPKWDMLNTLTYKPRKKKRNVLTRMESELTDGPFSILYRSIDENLRVRVWTRSYNHVRGICTGYLAAYDKHWNLAMYDVDEVYRNPLSVLPVKQKKRAKRKKNKKKHAICQKDTKQSEDTTEKKVKTEEESLKKSEDPETKTKYVDHCETLETKEESDVQSKMDNLKIKESSVSAEEDDSDNSLDDEDLVALKEEMERLKKELAECPQTSCTEDVETTSCADDESEQSESEPVKEQKQFQDTSSKLDPVSTDMHMKSKEEGLDSGSEAASEGSEVLEIREDTKVTDDELESGEITSGTDSDAVGSDTIEMKDSLDVSKKLEERKHKSNDKTKCSKSQKSQDLREKLLRQRTKDINREESKPSVNLKRSTSETRRRRDSSHGHDDSRRNSSKSCDRRYSSHDKLCMTNDEYSAQKRGSSQERERRDRSSSSQYACRNRSRPDTNYRSSKGKEKSHDSGQRYERRSSSRNKRDSSRRPLRDRGRLCSSRERDRRDRKNTDSSEESEHNRHLSSRKKTETRGTRKDGNSGRATSIKRTQAGDQSIFSSNQPVIPSLLSLKVCPPKLKPHSDVLQRHVNQLFIRGDNVVMVSLVQ